MSECREETRELIELVRWSPQLQANDHRRAGTVAFDVLSLATTVRAQGEVGLVDRKPEPGAVWNRLRPAEQTTILEAALQQPDLSPRELACQSPTMPGSQSRKPPCIAF